MKVIDLKLTRFVAGSPGEVFDVWFDPESPGGPWHGARKVLMNVAVDGLFYFGIDRAQLRSKIPTTIEGAELLGHFGRFTAIDRPRAAEHTWMSEHTLGVETTVSVTFDARGGGTEMTLVHRGVPAGEPRDRHDRGWNFLLSRVAEHFSKSR
jgi:uncharacterized protein YndB with AHSA1/START domain